MRKNISLIKNVILSNFFRLTQPYKLTFALTYKCNLRCKTCFIWKKNSKNELSSNDIYKFFKNSNNFSWIDLTGGEIFLRKDIFDIVDVILESCPNLRILHFPTNGQFPDETIRLVEKILWHKGISLVVTVSIDGPQDVHDKIRGQKGAWQRSVETFKQLKRFSKGYYYLGLTISDYNLDCFDKTPQAIKEVYPEFNAQDLHFNIFQRSFHYYNNAHMPEVALTTVSDRVKKICQTANRKLGIKSFLEKQYFKGLSIFQDSKASSTQCQALSASCFIDPYGDIYPCTIYSKKLANLKGINYNLGEAWKSKDFLELRNAIAKGHCPRCWTPCEAYPAILGSLFFLKCR